MSIPISLGKKVVSKQVSWTDLVVREWGAEWRKPDMCYFFSNGNTKECTDQQGGGVYDVTVLNRLLIDDTSNHQYPDMIQDGLELQDLSGIVGIG